MRVLYLMTAPAPAIDGTDAVVQEAEALAARTNGEMLFLPFSSKPRRYVPRWLYGLHLLGKLRRLDERVDVHHIFHAELYPFPVLGFLRKPILYTAVSGHAPNRSLPSIERLRKIAGIVVPSEREKARLTDHGLKNIHVLRAGIELSQFRDTPPPPHDEFILLAGSAPWTSGQFRTKGFDLLLDTAQREPRLRLVLLWRGWLAKELHERVRARGLENRVEILTERADVGQVMSRVHAAIVLSDAQRRVKAYPHSLIEALACGRPVLVSRCIAMAEYVEQESCGEVVESLTAADLSAAIERLEIGYEGSRTQAARVGHRDFSLEDLVRSYSRLYSDLIAAD